MRQELTKNVLNLTHADYTVREAALLDLSRKREEYPDLAPMLWHTYGVLTALRKSCTSAAAV